MIFERDVVDVDAWEYPLVLLYIFAVGVIYSRRKNIAIKVHPEYRYYLWGLYAKIVGGIIFTVVYLFYYKGGDTVVYFDASVTLANVFREDPGRYFYALFAENSWENYFVVYDHNTGYPIDFVYVDDRIYILVKWISPVVLLCMNSILLTVCIVSTIAYGGVWLLYRTLLRYYPLLSTSLAFSVIFFPSAIFWGSGILKDTFTFTALCWFIYSVDRIFFQKRGGAKMWTNVIIASYVMIAMKPYVFMMIVPSSLLWVLYYRMQRFRNAFVRLFLLPLGLVGMGALSFYLLNSLEDRLGKFSLTKALDTVIVVQSDLKRTERYGGNYFDLGDIEATWGSVFAKFPQAVFAGLYRPTLLDVNNVVMLLSALENTFLLLLSLYILWRSRIVFLITLILRNPMLQMFFLFSISYAFMIAITTPNFGAMVRFKIPLLPLFVSGLFITRYILDRRLEAKRSGRGFNFQEYEDGDPLRHKVVGPSPVPVRHGKAKRSLNPA